MPHKNPPPTRAARDSRGTWRADTSFSIQRPCAVVCLIEARHTQLIGWPVRKWHTCQPGCCRGHLLIMRIQTTNLPKWMWPVCLFKPRCVSHTLSPGCVHLSRSRVSSHPKPHPVSALNGIVSPTYGGAVYLGIEPMTGMLLSRTSWRLYYETGIVILACINLMRMRKVLLNRRSVCNCAFVCPIVHYIIHYKVNSCSSSSSFHAVQISQVV